MFINVHANFHVNFHASLNVTFLANSHTSLNVMFYANSHANLSAMFNSEVVKCEVSLWDMGYPNFRPRPFRDWTIDSIPELGIGRQNPWGNTVVPGGHLPGLGQDATYIYIVLLIFI